MSRKNNAVFNKGGSPDSPAKSVIDFDIPTQQVPLPSKGAVYPDDSPLNGAPALEIRAMTAREEDILTSRALIKNGTVITKLLESCLIDQSINVRDMLAGDRNAIMVGVRITGYGQGYAVDTECGECDHKQETEFDLARLPVKPLSIEPVSPGTNEFEFVLPLSAKRVRFKFLTGADEEDISKAADRMKRKGFINESLVTTRLQYSILSIDGVTDRAAITNAVRRMPAQDSAALRKYINTNEPGVDMTQEVECTSCGVIEDVAMPLGATFFWPAG